MDAKTISAAMSVHENTVTSWARGGHVIARRLVRRGPWRFLQAPDGRTVDADTPEHRSPWRPQLAPQWVTVEQAARAAGVNTRSVRRWVARGDVVHRRHARGHGLIEVALDRDGLLADAWSPGAAQVAADATATAIAQEAERRRRMEGAAA